MRTEQQGTCRELLSIPHSYVRVRKNTNPVRAIPPADQRAVASESRMAENDAAFRWVTKVCRIPCNTTRRAMMGRAQATLDLTAESSLDLTLETRQ